jgi:hypothetical protein
MICQFRHAEIGLNWLIYNNTAIKSASIFANFEKEKGKVDVAANCQYASLKLEHDWT